MNSTTIKLPNWQVRLSVDDGSISRFTTSHCNFKKSICCRFAAGTAILDSPLNHLLHADARDGRPGMGVVRRTGIVSVADIAHRLVCPIYHGAQCLPGVWD